MIHLTKFMLEQVQLLKFEHYHYFRKKWMRWKLMVCTIQGFQISPTHEPSRMTIKFLSELLTDLYKHNHYDLKFFWWYFDSSELDCAAKASRCLRIRDQVSAQMQIPAAVPIRNKELLRCLPRNNNNKSFSFHLNL